MPARDDPTAPDQVYLFGTSVRHLVMPEARLDAVRLL